MINPVARSTRCTPLCDALCLNRAAHQPNPLPCARTRRINGDAAAPGDTPIDAPGCVNGRITRCNRTPCEPPCARTGPRICLMSCPVPAQSSARGRAPGASGNLVGHRPNQKVGVRPCEHIAQLGVDTGSCTRVHSRRVKGRITRYCCTLLDPDCAHNGLLMVAIEVVCWHTGRCT